LTPPKKEEEAAAVEAPRPSHDEDKKSNSADSDASYDLVSGATSMGPGTPNVGAVREKKGEKEDSDDEDWE